MFIVFEANMFLLQEKYGKKYEPEEEKFRMRVFMENKYKILQHNAAFEKGQHSFKLGMNQYGDMVNEKMSLVFLYNVIVVCMSDFDSVSFWTS